MYINPFFKRQWAYSFTTRKTFYEEKISFSPLDLTEWTRRNASLSSVSIAEGEE